MKSDLLVGSIVGAITGTLYCYFFASYFYDILKLPVFSQEKAPIVAVILFFTCVFYAWYTASKKGDVLSKSKDKRKALNHAPARTYLSNKPNGLTVGKHKGNYVRIPFLDSPEHQLIVGAPGDNKSSTILNAILYNMNYATEEEKLCSILAVDIKPELSYKGVYENNLDVRIVNPTRINSTGFFLYYGISTKDTDDALHDRFSMIANTIIEEGGSENSFFWKAARQILTAFLMYGFLTNKTFGDCISEIMECPVSDLIAQVITDELMTNHPRVRHILAEYDGKTSDAFQDITMTLKENLAIFDTASVKACFDSTKADKVSPIDLVTGTSIFLVVPEGLIEQYGPVFRLILNTCMTHILMQDESHRANKRPIWVLIDEAGTIGQIPILKSALARGRSKGIQCTIALQSLADFDHSYGKDGRRAIMDYCKTTIVFGSNDSELREDLSKRTGYYHETRVSTTTRLGGMTDGGSRNESSEYRPVIDSSDIDRLAADKKVLVFAKEGWFLVDKTPYFEIPQFNKKSIDIVQRNEELHKRRSSN